MDGGSDMDEPMGSQSKDAEPSLSHNNSKNNFFSEDDPRNISRADDSAISRSTVMTTMQMTPNPVSSPYQAQARVLQGYSSPHILQKPLKRSGTPDHMLSETGVEMRALPPRQTQSPTVNNAKVRGMGGVPTALAGAPPPTVSSPGRYSGLTTPSMYSHAPSTTYNPGYVGGRRYLSEGELLEPQQMMAGGVGPSTSAGHIQDLAGSPNKSFYLWKTEGGSPPVSYAHPASSSPSHSYAQQVGYYLQQPVSDFMAPTIQSGGPRTTPSGYPGGPMVPSGHVSPKMSRRPPHGSSPYGENVIRTAPSPHNSPQGPMTFTRALEVTDKIQMRGPRPPPPGTHPGQPNNGGGQPDNDPNRESMYDVNYEISV